MFMTGGALTGRAEEFFQRYSNRCIQKPFDLRELRSLVRARGDRALRGPGEASGPVRAAAPPRRGVEPIPAGPRCRHRLYVAT